MWNFWVFISCELEKCFGNMQYFSNFLQHDEFEMCDFWDFWNLKHDKLEPFYNLRNLKNIRNVLKHLEPLNLPCLKSSITLWNLYNFLNCGKPETFETFFLNTFCNIWKMTNLNFWTFLHFLNLDTCFLKVLKHPKLFERWNFLI